MKFTVILAFLGAVVMANPIHNTISAGNVTAEAAMATCDDCKAYFEKCHSGILCYINPLACYESCKVETCRAYDGYCGRECDWKFC